MLSSHPELTLITSQHNTALYTQHLNTQFRLPTTTTTTETRLTKTTTLHENACLHHHCLRHCRPRRRRSTPQSYGSFFVNNFVFGCTSGCYYSFDVSFTTMDTQFSCSGSLEDKDYVECKGDVSGESYSAYIDNTTDATANILKLQLTVDNYPDEGTTTHWYGEDQVYAVTSSDADKQEASFSVDATKMSAVA
jgi:hypothetical protein